MGNKYSDSIENSQSDLMQDSINKNRVQSSNNQNSKSYRCPICRKIITQKSNKEFQAHYNRCQHHRNTINNLMLEPHSNVDLDLLNLFNSVETNATNLEKKNKKSLNQPQLVNEFEGKIESFRDLLRKMKVDWVNGCNTIEIDRDDIVKQSMSQFKTIDPYKELKIAFKGEVNYDAGGLIREWLSVLFKHFFDEKTNLFEKADTEDISYLIKSRLRRTPDNSAVFFFIGQLIGKALLENLTINCCFNKLIYKIILDESIELEDLIFIDKSLYRSLTEMKKIEKIEDLEVYFSIQYETQTGKYETEEFVPEGNSIKVTNDNVSEYIFLRIEHLVNSQKEFIDIIKSGINKIISNKILKQLSSDEFELVLNGTPFIDLEDWKENTTYKNYKSTDFVTIYYIYND